MQNLKVYCTAQKLSEINDFLVFAFAKKQSKSKKAKKQRSLGMSLSTFILHLSTEFQKQDREGVLCRGKFFNVKVGLRLTIWLKA